MALSEFKKRQPDLFVTLTQNDNWPEIRVVIDKGIGASYTCKSKEYLEIKTRGKSPVDYPVEMVIAFYRRLQEFKDRVLKDPEGIFGNVEDYWLRVEYQKRGGLHVHMVLWVEEGSLPENAIESEMPRFEHPHNEKWREYVNAFQIHSCRPKRCHKGFQGKMTKRCKYGFPFKICDEERIDETGIRYLYRRREKEDCNVAFYYLRGLLLWVATLRSNK